MAHLSGPTTVPVQTGFTGSDSKGNITGYTVYGLDVNRGSMIYDIAILPVRGGFFKPYWIVTMHPRKTTDQRSHRKCYVVRSKGTGKPFRRSRSPQAMFEELRIADANGFILPCQS